MKHKLASKKNNLWRSVGAALLGVQSDHSRQQDFSQPSALPFILAGLVAIFLFVGMLVIISRFVAG
ncbi:DUF2970 domain-containing protein [Photobacterium sp. WH77]|uniref:DUF2970 domain-containing protein n=1 Tax=unclassified Photobacterium TaxID=2628852 RepID=UPI001ED9C922|nr:MULTISPECIES: DUF2970 domain-containing protein [unclassified Photobacterium]MCG2837053.1 DUF2970 domain-containing protein [Photobacterium sp. WH77]MCG2844797.1 DUF2970 domain-containing protein [Photobacterium sp. WH80]